MLLRVALTITYFSVATAVTCDAIKRRYQAESCCDSDGAQPVCVPESIDVTSWSTTALGLTDCLSYTRTRGGVASGCESHLASSSLPRVALSNGRVAQDNSVYSAFVGSPSFHIVNTTTVQTSPSYVEYPGNELRNFWHSISLTDEHVYLGVRHQPPELGGLAAEGMGMDSFSGVYRFDRATLAPAGMFPGLPIPSYNPFTGQMATVTKGLMRYAPVVADGHVFSTHWGYFDPGSRMLYKSPVDTFPAGTTSREVSNDFELMRGGMGVVGPMASQRATDNETCGTRLYISSMSFGYFSPFNDEDQTRPIGLDNLASHRGRIQCYCSKTMEPCWDEYYFNGKAGGMPSDFEVVEAKHVNTDRTDYLGTVRQVACASLGTPIGVDRLIPKAFVVTMSTPSFPVGTLLESETGNVKLLVDDSDVTGLHVSYYAGHYNTPAVGMTFMVDGNSSVTTTLTALHQIILDHGYAPYVDASATNPDAPDGKAFVQTSIIESTHNVSTFSDNVVLDDAALAAACASTDGYSEVVVWPALALGQPDPITVDFSGLTLKTKHAVGETLPADGRKAVHSSGGNNWVPCAVDEASDTLLCPFGNAHMLSFDRYQVMKPVLALQRLLEQQRKAAIDARDADAVKSVLARHSEILALNAKQMALLSDYDRAFKEDAIHAIDTKTGALKWSTQLEGTDQWFVGWTSVSNFGTFDQFWDVTSASAFGTDIWKDVDANNVAVDGDTVYATTKGGTLATLDLATGKVRATHRVAPGVPSGNSAPGNYGGFCANKDGVMVMFACAGASPSAVSNYTWMTADGKLVAKDKGYIVAWDSRSQTELWSVVIDIDGAVGGITCIEGRVVAPCANGKGVCNYDARTGVVSQTITADAVKELPATFLGTKLAYASSSTICDGPECFMWRDDNKLTKLRMI